jgi:chromosome segregation ATPase
LKQLNIELAQQQSRQTHIGQQVTDLQTDINDLTKTVADVKNILTDYAGQLKDLETRLHGLRFFYDQKHKMIMAAIGDKKPPIDNLIEEFDEELARMQGAIDELTEKVQRAQEESTHAAAIQAEKQAAYDAAKAYTTNTVNQLNDLDTLRTGITKADDATDIASMYFLVVEFHHVLHHTEIISQHQLSVDLRHKLGELEAAKENARTKTADYNSLQTELTAQQATLATKKAGRRQQLLAAVQALYPAPAPSATPGSGAGSGSGGSSTGSTGSQGATGTTSTTGTVSSSQPK